MIDKKSWDDFRNTGLLWFINTILHVFGWAIVVEGDKDENGNFVTKTAYPARVKYRGFSEDVNDRGYENITDYMVNNAKELWDEVEENK